MRIALLSDIHGNLPALEAVLADMDGRARSAGPWDAVYHLGDLVGYGPWPDEVVELLAERGITGVAGNYDSSIAHGHPHCGCRYDDPREEALSGASYDWTRDRVDSSTVRALRSLPFRIDVRGRGGHASGPTLFLFHGAPTLNTLYWTEDRDDAFCRKMAERVGGRPGDVLAFGHTHRPFLREVNGIRFLNTGSVGRPKDGDPRGCWVELELGNPAGNAGTPTVEDVRVDHVRVEYDVDRAVRAIGEAGLPEEFGVILRSGGFLSAAS